MAPNLLLGLGGQQNCNQTLGGQQSFNIDHQSCNGPPPSLSSQQACGGQVLTGQLSSCGAQSLNCHKPSTGVQHLPLPHPSLAPSTPTQQQQQPLNLQRSQIHLQHHTDNSCNESLNNETHASSNSIPLPLCQPISSCGSLPLGLHSPYYVSLSPMLPLHMTQATGGSHHHFHSHIAPPPHHHAPYPQHHQQHFQHDVVSQHPHALLPATPTAIVNNHGVYQ